MVTYTHNKSLAALSTFRMGGFARLYTTVTEVTDIPEIVAHAASLTIPLIIIGGGSNTLFPDGILDALVCRMEIGGTQIEEETEDAVKISVGAGVLWDTFVADMCTRGYSGIEALSSIPGSVGGTPIQNVGAYGQEVSQVIDTVHVYDKNEYVFKILTNKECQFTYRDSIFKHEPNRYIVVSVTFSLSKKTPQTPHYPGVEAYFQKHSILSPTLMQIRTAIVAIRADKLPDPREIASVGSFFKNPFITQGKADEIRALYPGAVLFPIDEHTYKIGAGWMIDSLGLKGYRDGNLGLYEHNALVVVNHGEVTREELRVFITDIQKRVYEKFGITIEPEPIWI